MSFGNWNDEARKLQETFSCQYVRCAKLNYATDWSSIKTFLGIGLFGIPENNDATEIDKLHMLYNEDQRKIIDSIYRSIGKVKTSSSVLYLRNTYLVLKDEDDKTLKFATIFPFSFTENGQVLFVDPYSRIYKNWYDFLENNQLPSCYYCAPLNGYYQSNVEFIFKRSPANKASKKALNVLDVATSVAGVGSAIVGTIAAGPVLVPAAICTGIGAGMYSVSRSISRLVDRSTHKQSIGLQDQESRMCYFNVVTSVLNGASVGAFAKSSALVSKFGANAVTGIRVLNGVTIAVDGICVADSLINVYSKYTNDGTVNKAELFNVAVQLFFITVSVVNIRKLHTELSVASQNKTSMTKTQKRNLRKKLAKARLRGDLANSNITMKQYDNQIISNDTFCNNLIRQCPQLVLGLLPKSASTIIRTFTVIRGMFEDLQNKKITKSDFFLNVAQHIQNVWYIVKRDFNDVVEKVKHLFHKFELGERFRSIAAMLHNSISEIEAIEANPEENNSDFDAIKKTLDYTVIKQIKKFVGDIIKQFENVLSSENCTVSINFITQLHKEIMIKLTSSLNEEMKYIRQQIIQRNSDIFTEQFEKNLRKQVINTDIPFIEEAMRKVSIKFDSKKLKNIFDTVKQRCELEQEELFFVSKSIPVNKITDCLNNLSDIIFELYECVINATQMPSSYKSIMLLINKLTDFVCNEFETSAWKTKDDHDGIYKYYIDVKKYTIDQFKEMLIFDDKYVWDEICKNFHETKNDLKNKFEKSVNLNNYDFECRDSESDYLFRNNDSAKEIMISSEELDHDLKLNFDPNSNQLICKSQKILYIVGMLIKQGVLRGVLKTTTGNISTLVRMFIPFVHEKIIEDMRKWKNELGAMDLFTFISDQLAISAIYKNGHILMTEFGKFCTIKIEDERTQILNDVTDKDGEVYLENVNLGSDEDIWRILKKLFDINRECVGEITNEKNCVLLKPNCDNIQFILMTPLNDHSNCSFIVCFRKQTIDDDDDSFMVVDG